MTLPLLGLAAESRFDFLLTDSRAPKSSSSPSVESLAMTADTGRDALFRAGVATSSGGGALDLLTE